MHETTASYPIEGLPRPLRAQATLRLPDSATRSVVVIAHGTSGRDSRGPAYATALAEAGIASLEIDMWAPRGLKGGLDRPRSVHETLPDVFSAFRYLTERPEFDALRIGVLGFSWGGALSLLSATRAVARRHLRNGERFAAHVALYPVCWLFNRVEGFEFRDLTGAPVLLQAGGADGYDPPGAAEALRAGLDAFDRDCLRVLVHPGATHAFDQIDEPARIVTDPFAHEGRGGEVAFTPDPVAGARARAETVEFLRRALAAG